jgi:SHS2 domain-containing protein
MAKKYRVFGTTADVGVVSSGKDLKEAFENQAAGMFSIMTDMRHVRPVQAFHVEAEGKDPEGLLIAWLNELLFLCDTGRVFLKGFEITYMEHLKLKANAYGEGIDPGRHVVKTEVKAVTYHRLEVRRTRKGVRTRVVYDI